LRLRLGDDMRGLLVALILIIVTPIGAQAQRRPPAPPADMLAAPNHPGWSVDSGTGCWVWNSHPQPTETVTWSGGCGADGRASGHGVEEFRYDEEVERYEGDLRDGRANGHGVSTDVSGTRYEGEWRDDKTNGHGVMTNADGSRYDGNWRDDRPDGYGEAWIDGETYRGNWVGGCYRDGNRKTAWERPLSECP